VLASVTLSAAFIVVQPKLLAGRDPAAVTAVQFGAGALFAAPIAAILEGAPGAPTAAPAAIAVGVLALGGTLLPFWLFAFAQSRVPAELAGAFVNLEPVVGAAAGWLALGETAAAGQVVGAIVVVAGIVVSTLPPRRRVSAPAWAPPGSVPAHVSHTAHDCPACAHGRRRLGGRLRVPGAPAHRGTGGHRPAHRRVAWRPRGALHSSRSDPPTAELAPVRG